jgi:hemolysin activation/secretion protein
MSTTMGIKLTLKNSFHSRFSLDKLIRLQNSTVYHDTKLYPKDLKIKYSFNFFSKLHFVKQILVSVLMLSSWILDASAQNSIPGTIEMLPRPEETRPDLPEFGVPTPPELDTPRPLPPQLPRLSTGPSLFLRGVRFTDNTIFSDRELAGIADPFVGRMVSSEDLQDLRYRLTEHYINAGYINSGAILPDQDVRDGIVSYTIIEGRLSEISVTGNERLQPSYVTDRLALGTGPPLNIDDLRERIQILLQDPLIERLNAELRPGLQPGDSILDVAVTRAQPYELRVSFDNNVSPSIGEFRGRIDGVVRNLTGWGDAVDLFYGRTGGLDEGGGGIVMPITPYDTKLSLRFEINNAAIVEQPLNELDIRSQQRSIEVGVSQPVYRTPRQELDLGLTLTRSHSETTLLGRPFTFSSGEHDGESDVTALRVSQNWVSQSIDQVVAARSTFSFGLDWLNATTNPDDLPDGQFVAWLGQFQWARRFGEAGPQLIFRTDAQWTKDALLPTEKFTIGGFESVRGYRKNTLVRDGGLIVSLEGRIPVFRLPVPGLSRQAEDGLVQIAPFADYGRGWNNTDDTIGPNDVYGVGVGLRWAPSQDTLAQLYFGHALRDTDQPDKGLQSDGIYFSVTARVF